MKKIEKFDKQNLQLIREQIQKALDEVGKQNGLSIKIQSVTFSELFFYFKTEVKIEGKETDYSEKAPWLDLPKLGTQFRINKKIFTVVQHKIRLKEPVIAKGEDGKLYKFTTELAKKELV